MTATQETPLIDQLKAVMPEPIISALGMTVTMLTVSILEIKDEATAYDYGRAVEDLVDTLLGEVLAGQFGEYDYKSKPRPESDDTRPLYQRIEQHASLTAARIIRQSWSKLNLMALATGEVDLALKFHGKVVEPFGKALGIPSRSEFQANPEQFPNVGSPKIIDEILESVKRAEEVSKQPIDATSAYRLGR